LRRGGAARSLKGDRRARRTLLTEPEKTLTDEDIRTELVASGASASLQDDPDTKDADDTDDTDADDDAVDDAGADDDATDEGDDTDTTDS
jgi:hypothetical protein